MDSEIPPFLFINMFYNAGLPLVMSNGIGIELIFLIVLITCSALISGAEVAFFSLSPGKIRGLEEETNVNAKRIIQLRKNPRKLLATILISNNFVNIAIVVVSQIILNSIFGPQTNDLIGNWINDHLFASILDPIAISTAFNFFVTVVLVTFILVLFGEIAPKIYANIDNLSFAKMMATPLSVLNFVFNPISSILVNWGKGIERKITDSRNYQTGTSKEDLDAAIELTVNTHIDASQEVGILKGIVKFGDLSAKQVMKPRIDIIAIEIETQFDELMKIVLESGYSRIPIYEDDYDKITGMLYVKDLLGHTTEGADFNWQSLIRKALIFVPETKKIDDLLREFQLKRLHMAIVVNEFGGTVGIVTLEDIMEEVIGDIKDEFDEDEDVDYIRLGEGNYIFEGKTLLNDVCRVLGEKTSYFDDVKGNADSLAGMIIEIMGDIPRAEKEITVKEVTLKVVTATSRRIEKINLKVKSKESKSEVSYD